MGLRHPGRVPPGLGPHRQARLLSVPDVLVAVTREQLEALVAEALFEVGS